MKGYKERNDFHFTHDQNGKELCWIELKGRAGKVPIKIPRYADRDSKLISGVEN